MKTYSLVISALVISSLPNAAHAHVRYLVADPVVGADWNFLFSALSDPLNIGLIIGTIVVLVIATFAAYRIPMCRRELTVIRNNADSYMPLTPWMLRLSIGIALIGAGVADVLVSPVLTIASGLLSFAQVLLGFMLLTGFLVMPAAFAALVLFLTAVFQDWYVLGNLDFAAIALALLILDNERPGIDDIIGMPNMSPIRSLKAFVPLILRIGVGGAMIFLALFEKVFNPRMSEDIVVNFGLIDVIPVSPEMWVLSAGVIELAIGILILVGLRVRFIATVAFVVLGLSFFYFNEAVWSHITLFGALSVLFVTRGGKWSIDHLVGVVNPHESLATRER